MRPDEQYNHYNSQQAHSSKKLELFFFETVGNRSYLRFTKLAVILILCLTLISLVGIFTLFLYNRASSSSEQINVNVRAIPSPTATPFRNVIIQAPPPQSPPPKMRMQPLLPAPTLPATPLESDRNMNEQPVPGQTPLHPQGRPPT
jgi:hypothetical protein